MTDVRILIIDPVAGDIRSAFWTRNPQASAPSVIRQAHFATDATDLSLGWSMFPLAPMTHFG